MSKPFNENPFAKNTEVEPFSNATEAQMWQENNCHKCINYESESQNEESAKCKLAFNLDLGYICGFIELWVAKDIGCTYNALYQTCNLDKKCRQFRAGDEPF